MSRLIATSQEVPALWMHLQWFAAEDEGRTEEPTEHKIRKAREEGKVAKSVDLNSALILFVTVLAIAFGAQYIFRNFVDMIRLFLGYSPEYSILGASGLLRTLFRYYIRIVLPIVSVAFIAAIISNFIQVGPLFTLKPLQPDFNRIAPRLGRFLRRAFLSAEAGFNLFKSWLKLFIILAIGLLNVLPRIEMIINIVRVPFTQSALLFTRILFNIVWQSAIVMLIISLFDYQFQRRQHRESLKMTPQEVKEERKTQEGDPLVRNRLQQRMREILSRNMLRNVPSADVVITNPLHYAVALEYDNSRMNAPMVIAKGADHIAQRIRTTAWEHDIPTVENPPLARGLYQEVEIGDSIPEKFYEVVVTILSEIYRLRGVPAGVING